MRTLQRRPSNTETSKPFREWTQRRLPGRTARRGNVDSFAFVLGIVRSEPVVDERRDL